MKRFSQSQPPPPEEAGCSPMKKCKIEDVDKEDESFLSQIVFKEEPIDDNEDVEPKEFDLETIFAEKIFDVKYGSLINSMIEDVKIMECGKNKHVERLFAAIVDVFSMPMNCVYFNKSELNFVRRFLTISEKAQIVLARLLKWKPGWYRVSKVSLQLEMPVYEQIVKELTENGFFDCDYSTEDTSVLIDMMLVDELKEVAKRMKVPHTTAKPKLKEELLKIDAKKKAMFIGVKTPSQALRKLLEDIIGPSIKISENCWSLIKRIMTLLYPIQNYNESFSDIFRILNEVFYETRVYPSTPKERFPIFRNRQHLIDFTEAKEIYYEISNAVVNKNWELVKNLGTRASERLTDILDKKMDDVIDKPPLPSHVRRFEPSYVWAKIIWTSIDGFKKNPEDVQTATKYLRTLISYKDVIQGRRGRWFAELALIEMSHNKNLEASVNVTLRALTGEKLSAADIAEMLERARKLASRKSGISTESRELMQQLIDEHKSPVENIAFNEVTVEANMMQYGISNGTKSVWRLDIGENNTEYLSVEMLAAKHYQYNGFSRNIHCEGKLPVTLFSCFFWNELYTIPVPGAFVCPYQIAPLDLFGSQFFANRQEQLNARIASAEDMDIEDFSNFLSVNYMMSKEYMSLTYSLVELCDEFKDIIKCLGKKAVIGICKLVASNYCQWSSGFPDLFVWDTSDLKCKIVEVKGPGDTLSIKQKLWIKHLLEFGVDTEVCYVKPR
ncbi:fanconi-associated nuclease 1-like [Chelonus insularis]|uniref:fanconi-associated nuclease 1-like n=1 Tax=Chelonus insularis TaxID=460826 RepID=UPI00158E58D7|nr:fanconi-associated nuclease 1-like [Chelonus insularis]